MASAGPYASLHLAPDRQPRQHPTTQFFYRAGCPSCRPTNMVKALKAALNLACIILTKIYGPTLNDSRAGVAGSCRWATWRAVASEGGVCAEDLRVAVKRNIAADHVVEQNAERPDGRRHRVVAPTTDPLRRTVHPSTCRHTHHDNVYRAVIMTTVIARVQPVHLTNVD